MAMRDRRFWHPAEENKDARLPQQEHNYAGLPQEENKDARLLLETDGSISHEEVQEENRMKQEEKLLLEEDGSDCLKQVPEGGIEKINKDMQLILYSPALWVIHT